ncbi:MAG: hypothetical protein M3217_08090, partial [Actinomycetota bacterium]|nr:hypothetical protein [Actinomycetota bacterium]
MLAMLGGHLLDHRRHHASHRRIGQDPLPNRRILEHPHVQLHHLFVLHRGRIATCRAGACDLAVGLVARRPACGRAVLH